MYGNWKCYNSNFRISSLKLKQITCLKQKIFNYLRNFEDIYGFPSKVDNNNYLKSFISNDKKIIKDIRFTISDYNTNNVFCDYLIKGETLMNIFKFENLEKNIYYLLFVKNNNNFCFSEKNFSIYLCWKSWCKFQNFNYPNIFIIDNEINVTNVNMLQYKDIMEKHITNVKNMPYIQHWKDLDKLKELTSDNIRLTYEIVNQCIEKNIYTLTNLNIYDLNLDISALSFERYNNILNFQKTGKLISSHKLDLPFNIFENDILYIDFETTADNEFLFLIGIYYFNNNKYEYKYFLAQNILDEKQIVVSFINFLDNFDLPVCICWGNFEENLFTKKMKKYNIWKNIYWFDFCDYFKKHQIFVKDCFNYKLKSVVNALSNNELIDISYKNSNIKDGFICSEDAFKHYYEKSDYFKLNDIISYNELDCIVLQKILSVLKN